MVEIWEPTSVNIFSLWFSSSLFYIASHRSLMDLIGNCALFTDWKPQRLPMTHWIHNRIWHHLNAIRLLCVVQKPLVPENHHYYLSAGIISRSNTHTWKKIKHKKSEPRAKRAFSIVPAIAQDDRSVLMHTGDNNCLLILNLVISRSAVERKNKRRKIQFVLTRCWPTPKGCLWMHHFASRRE